MADLVKLSVLALGASLIFAVPTMAQDEPEGDTVTTTAEQENPHERICRRVHVTGSNIPQRVCMTRSEWSALREQSREDLEDAQNEQQMNAAGAASE